MGSLFSCQRYFWVFWPIEGGSLFLEVAYFWQYTVFILMYASENKLPFLDNFGYKKSGIAYFWIKSIFDQLPIVAT